LVLPKNFEFSEDFTEMPNTKQMMRDKKLAFDDPQRYCADRCVTTGNCEVFEDFYELSPTDVMKFCTDCVLSEGEEPCDIPPSFFPDGDDELEVRP